MCPSPRGPRGTAPLDRARVPWPVCLVGGKPAPVPGALGPRTFPAEETGEVPRRCSHVAMPGLDGGPPSSGLQALCEGLSLGWGLLLVARGPVHVGQLWTTSQAPPGPPRAQGECWVGSAPFLPVSPGERRGVEWVSLRAIPGTGTRARLQGWARPHVRWPRGSRLESMAGQNVRPDRQPPHEPRGLHAPPRASGGQEGGRHPSRRPRAVALLLSC